MKKTQSWIMVVLMALLVPALAGCKYKCHDAQGVKNDILRMQEIYEGALSDRVRWNYSCGELLALSARLTIHRNKLDRLATSRSCERNDSCTAISTLSNQMGELQTETQSICHEVQEGVANIENFASSSRGRALTYRARRVVNLIQNAIVPPGTVMLTQVCGDDQLFANLSPRGNAYNASAYSENASRSNDLIPPPADDEDESLDDGSAGAAR